MFSYYSIENIFYIVYYSNFPWNFVLLDNIDENSKVINKIIERIRKMNFLDMSNKAKRLNLLYGKYLKLYLIGKKTKKIVKYFIKTYFLYFIFLFFFIYIMFLT